MTPTATGRSPSDARTRAQARFAAYIAPATRFPHLWRLLAGLGLAMVIYLALNLGAFAALVFLGGGLDGATRDFALGPAFAETPWPTLILFATFLPLLAGTILAARVFQRRGAGTLFGPRARVLRDFALAALLMSLFQGASLIGAALFAGSAPNLPLGLWLALLPATLLAVAIQTLAEELLFRGYMLQQLAARFRSPFIWMGVPALVFAVLHYDPTGLGPLAPMAVAAAAGFGLMAADLTARTGSIGAAWGAHFANNLWLVAVFATDPRLGGLALRESAPDTDAMADKPAFLLLDMVILLCAWALLRWRLGR